MAASLLKLSFPNVCVLWMCYLHSFFYQLFNQEIIYLFLRCIGILKCSWYVIKSIITTFGCYRMYLNKSTIRPSVGIGFDHVTNCMFISQCISKNYILFLIFIFILIYSITFENDVSTRNIVLKYSSHYKFEQINNAYLYI